MTLLPSSCRKLSFSLYRAFKALDSLSIERLSFDQHVNNTCRSCYHHIRALRHIRDSLPDEVVKTVAYSIIGSRIDYCNALLSGTSNSNFNKLQRVQNTLARVVLRKRKFDHITPALEKLHWLPVNYRVTFKTAALVYSIKNTGQPAYLRQILQDYVPVRSLRSSSRNLLCKSTVGTVLASRGFRHSAVAVWNNLPEYIRDDKTLLTFLNVNLKLIFLNQHLAPSSVDNVHAYD